MSEETPGSEGREEGTGSAGPSGLGLEQYAIDLGLQRLVSYVEDLGMSITITLWVGGAVVSGIVVSAQEYWEHLRDRWAGFLSVDLPLPPLEDVAAQGLPYTGADQIVHMLEVERELSARRNEERRRALTSVDLTPLEGDDPRYIHLRSVSMWTAEGPARIGGEDLWWRGRLAAVDGFTLMQIVSPEEARAQGYDS